ncbi:cell envelope integrity protein TolA [Flavilitoribacter nigricans]|uniref:TonB family protein n=1 Tax=Flavilitoribacter nigricans (strain ATCC 23147 / DSM 23189 / NBRC 102662 / NCIMB 1420 / SS-2) TaxID=1122177 RepID=A0A2D0N883_FLAN2|nr:cell envelope integrity protein TolA [Flavilitoribacter nigricans]PHN04600.1 hypothetical protein CRP01_21590 [Flavilitoribacter nigricans DSM 23189 = NBRC 102662]
MESIITHDERKNSNRGKVISVAVHIGLILLALLPLLTYPDPPPGQEGIVVNLGLPDIGQGDDNAGPTAPAEPEVAEETPEVEESQPEPEPEVSEPDPVVPEREVVETEDPEAIALKRKQAEEKKRQEEADRKKRAEEEAKRQAEAEAKRQAEAEAKRKAEADRLKNDIGGLFGDGGGKGNTGTAGNQGDPNGDPNAANLEGISSGSGRVGGGLGSRGVLKSPTVAENSQKAGTVVVNVCVDSSGDVVSAEYTQRGSTTADSQLVNAAIRNAKNWQFSRGSVDKQCGTISYNFKVK